MPPRAKDQPPLSTSTVGPRHPDTTADKGDVVRKATAEEVADLDPAGYGFHNIDTEGVEETHKAGPGFAPPTPVPVISSSNSTFAERAAAYKKVVEGGTEGVARK